MKVRCLFGWKHTQRIRAKVRMSLMCLRARTNGNVVCHITMRAHFVFENVLAKNEAFVWVFIVRSSRQEMGGGWLICDLCGFCLVFPSF